MKRFPFIFTICLVSIIGGLSLAAVFLAPNGTRWLGEGIVNPGDAAVYLSYLTQGTQGHVLLKDLYAIEPHHLRFDPIWSLLGVVAHLIGSPILVHEVARILFTIILSIALWFAAKSETKSERDTQLALLLAAGGISTGWMYSIWLGATGSWTPFTNAAPDIATEFALGPILLGGAHAILSVALLMTAVRFVWNALRTDKKDVLLKAGITSAALLSFHPYFAPLLVSIALLSFATQKLKRQAFVRGAILAGFFVPPLAYYVWLLRDGVFGSHHLAANILEPAPFHIWFITLLPFFVAFAWMIRAKQLPKRFEWTHAWLLASFLLVIFLPVPWKRKLTEGLTIPLVFMTLPAWITLRDWITRQPAKLLSSILTGLLCVAAFLGPIHLVISQLDWQTNPATQNVFFRSDEVFAGVDFLKQEPTNSILLSDDMWLNIWLPALTGQTVFVGHNHETPNYADKRERFREMMDGADLERARTLLQESLVTHFMTTTQAGKRRFESIRDEGWTPVFSSGTVGIWKRISP